MIDFTALSPLHPYLGDLDSLIAQAEDKNGKSYAQPALKNLGSVVIPVLREVISPASFRNAEAEITEINHARTRRVRAVANKFKFGERARGLQVLRLFDAGGHQAQNKTLFRDGDKPSAAYDMNTIVFGDSANYGNKVLPVKAAAQYSDALSLQDYATATDVTFHNRAAEDGTLFDAQAKANSTNIFERHFINPGTLLLQTVAFNGRTAPPEALEHFLLSLGLAGAYGGQTSIYGVNVRNHVIGIYAGRFERDIASPYVSIERIGMANDATVGDACKSIQALFAEAYPVCVSATEAGELLAAMIDAVEIEHAEFRARYSDCQEKVGKFFDAWFAGFE